VVQGEPFELSVVVTTANDTQLDELQLPDLSAFTILREQRASASQVHISGGKRTMTVEQRFIYVLRANDPGRAVIGDVNARAGQSIARAAAIPLTVTPSDDAPPAGATAGTTATIDRFGNSPPPAFLEVALDKSEAFVGEQVTGTTELYSQQPLSQWPRVPGLKPQGFLCVSLLGDERPAPTQRKVAGKSYYVYLLNKDALFPLAPGALTVPSMQVDVVPAGSMFSRGRPIGARSAERTVQVKAVPEEGRPARFSSSNVGSFELEVSVRPETVPLGQPATLTIAATGRGLLERIELPSWDGGDVARVFPSTKKIVRAQSDDLVAGRVVSEMLVQPSKEGKFTVPSLSWWIFDPDANAGAGGYLELKSKPVQVNVRSQNARAGAIKEGPSSGARQLVARGARPLKGRVRADVGGGPLAELPVGIGAALALAGAGVLVGKRTRERARGTVEGKRALARRDRMQRLDEAAKRGDLAALEQLLLDVLADRFGPAVKSTPSSALVEVLTGAGLSKADADASVAAIRDIESSRYAPSASGERARIAEQVRALACKIEEAA
jgi:BatD DUF11 like domain